MSALIFRQKIVKSPFPSWLILPLFLVIASCEPRKPVVGWTPQQYTEHEISSKLESIVLPTAWFDQCPVDQVIYFLQVRLIELDPEVELVRKGIDFHFTRTDPAADLTPDPVSQGRFELEYDDDIATRDLTFSRKNVRALDLLVDIAQRARIDVYLTSHGIYMVREGGEPIPEGSGEVKVFRAIRKAMDEVQGTK
jgi:hypothetical protein